MDLVTYLAFNGQCEEAFGLYERVLGGKIVMMLRYADAPPGEPVKPETAHHIMHARLQVGDRFLMGGDAPSPRYAKPQGFSASIQVDTPEDAERIYRELSAGGKVMMPIAETFWAERFAMFIDRFGTPWMVNCEKPMEGTRPQPRPKPFTISRTLDAPRDVVWKAFADVESLKQWWGPKGFKVTAAKLDLIPGGTFHYCLRMPNGEEMWGKFVYREIKAPEHVIFTNSFSDAQGGVTRHPMAPSWPLRMESRFGFRDAGRGKTELTVTCEPLDPTADEHAAFEGGRGSMTQGWGGTLEQLEKFLAKRKSAARVSGRADAKAQNKPAAKRARKT